MKRRGLSARLAVAFALVAVATAVIAGVVLTGTWQRQFERYIQRGIDERAEVVADAIARQYAQAGGWERLTVADLAHIAMVGDLQVHILDQDGGLVAYTAGRAGMMMGGEDPRGDVTEVSARADVVVDGEVVGEVVVAQNVPGGMLTERDIWFRRVSIAGLVLAAMIAVVLASLAGFVYSRHLIRPIEAVTRAAEALRRGDRSARTGMSGGDAIADLGMTFDQMADAVEAERRFEQQLTADVAHELRTPLQAIQATVEAMQDGVLPTDEERLGLIHDETVRLGRLAGSILDLSRLESGSAAFALAPIDLAAPVMVAIESSRALMESTGHALEERVEAGLVVMGDGDRLTQAVGNLLANAARHTPEGSTVRATVRAESADAVIEVADSGTGVAEEDRERVFARFWRGDPARARTSGGVGIGLAVVREIVERHGGTVAVGASDLGGAAFVVRIPRAG